MLSKVLFTKVIHLSLVRILWVVSVSQIVLLLVYIIILCLCQDGQVNHWIIYCSMGISYTTVFKKLLICYKLNDIGPQITAFQNTYNFCIGHGFFGRIRKHQSDNHIDSMLENSTFSVICRKIKRIDFVCLVCWK